MTRVLIADDHEVVRRGLKQILTDEFSKVKVSEAGTSQEALEAALAHPLDLVLLDINMPGRSGLDVLREVRGEPATRDLPMMVLTARSAEMDKLLGFDHGADDYLTKPFSPRELVARVRALLRRSQPEKSAGRIEAGDLRIDTLAREATFRDRLLTLTPREFDLLAFFATRPGRVFSRDELLRKVWGYDYLGETRTVDVHVRRLRMKLGERNRVIHTVTGAGYKLVAPSRGS